MDNKTSAFDQYFIVGQDSWLTAQIKGIILKNRNYICPVFKSIFSPFDSHLRSTNDRILALVDISVVTVEDLLKLISAHKLKSEGCSNLSIAFFNVSKSALAFPFLCVPGIRGFFQRDVEDALLVEGIVEITRGALWFPREFLSEVTGCAQIDPDMSATDSIQLTGRELDVLRYMSGGASDNYIADNAYVDSSTVKKQIGDIYKKLNLKSHTTAVRIAGGLATQEFALPDWCA